MISQTKPFPFMHEIHTKPSLLEKKLGPVLMRYIHVFSSFMVITLFFFQFQNNYMTLISVQRNDYLNTYTYLNFIEIILYIQV